MFIALSNVYIAFMIPNIRINCAKKIILYETNQICDQIELDILNLDSPFICDFDIGVLLDETLLADDRFGEVGRDRMLVGRRVLSLMDDEGGVTVVVCVKGKSCDSCCRRRRCCRSIETSVAGHAIDKFGDPGTIDCTDDAVIVVDVGVRGGQSEPVSSFPSALSPASPLLCLVCK